MKKYYFQIQFGHTGDEGNVTRTMTIFITKNDELVNSYDYRELTTSFFDKLLKRLENKNIIIKTNPIKNGYVSPKHLTIVISWDDIIYYTKAMIYKYQFKDSTSSLSNEYDIDENKILKIADEFIFLDDNNRKQEYENLCDILIYKKDTIYRFPWENSERITNLDFCKKYANKEFLKKYNHLIQAKNFDLL